MSDTRERPVSQLVDDLDWWLHIGTVERNAMLSEVLTQAKDALQAAEEREQRLRALYSPTGVPVLGFAAKVRAIIDGGKP